MRIKSIDHIVIPTSDLKSMIHFYVDLLGMKLDVSHNHYAVSFGNQKINLHVGLAEFLPAAGTPTYGSADICFLVEGSLLEIKAELEAKGVSIEKGIVCRNGAQGPIKSIYLRDPEGNLIELSTFV